MSAAPVIAVAAGAQIADAGALTAEAYLADELVDPDEGYTSELRDAERRAAEATLLVATVEASDGTPVVVGTITLAPHGTSYAEIAEPGELELRMLAVAPEARGRGIAEALMRAAMRQCVVAGARRIVLSTLDAMTAAQRLYGRLGFEAQLHRDWGHVEVHLRAYTWTPPEAPGVLIESATWPPTHVEVTPGGWRVGLAGGVTRRANSAVPGRDTSAAEITAVEALYAAAGQPSIVRVSASDVLLEAQLEERGYAIASDTDVLVRDLGPGTPEPARPHLQVRSATEPDEAWLTAWLGVKKVGADHAVARQVLVGAPADYLTAVVDNHVGGVIRVAYAEDWAGLSSLAVDPSLRRAGLGRELTLRALAVARRRGARRVFLQVEARNAGAALLYAGLGFQPADAYRYRELVRAGDGPPARGC